MQFARVTLVSMMLAVVMVAGPQGAQAQTAAAESAGQAGETKWVIDMVHSQVDFGVRHLVGSVRGTFTKWYALLTTKDGDWRLGKVDVSIETASLNTGNAYRDADLRSDRFFAVKRYPKMTFQGDGFMATDTSLDVIGTLTIKGYSKPVVLSGKYLGIARDREGHERIGFQATGRVDRRDFGMNWNESVAGTELIGNDVEITIGIEAVRID
jgi:polyisoprenoid-binding protein YceI